MVMIYNFLTFFLKQKSPNFYFRAKYFLKKSLFNNIFQIIPIEFLCLLK